MLLQETRSASTGAGIRWVTLGGLLLAMSMAWLLFYTLTGMPGGLLEDAGAGVHVRTGDWILDHGTIPRSDVFTFTASGKPWFAWEWLSDVIFAVLHRAGGLRLLVVFCAGLILTTATLLLKELAARSGDAVVSIVLLHIFLGAASVHFFARPHVFTLLFFALSLWLLDRGGRAQWWLVPLCALWCNLHGGFVGLLAILAVTMRWRLLAACTAATVVNPYGIALHLHIVEYLRAGWIRNIVAEFQPPKLDTTAGIYFEVVLFLGLLACGRLFAQRRWTAIASVLLWSHAAMSSVRHVPLLALVALPHAAELLGEWLQAQKGRSLAGVVRSLGQDHLGGVRTVGLLPALTLIGLLFAPAPLYRFPERRFPVEVASRNAALVASRQIVLPDYWGDYLIYLGSTKVFFDGRTDLFGKAFSEEYMRLFDARPGWEAVLEKYEADAALLPSDSPLAGALKARTGWSLADSGGGAVLLLRTAAAN